MGEKLSVEKCPDCSGGLRHPLYRDSEYVYFECGTCRGIYCDPKAISNFQEVFSEDYYRQNYMSVEQITIEYYKRSVIPLLRSHVPEGGRILDVGCGAGFFLKAARDAGYQVVGVEPSAFASNYCRTRWDIECHTGYLEDLSASNFDLVVLLNVFSHVTTEKRELLATIREKLKPGGTFLIKTVCWNRYYPLICGLIPHEGFKRFCLHLPLQYYIYNKRNIKSCLEIHHFKPVFIKKCFGEWSILKYLRLSKPKLSIALLVKWMLLKSICGPFKTDMLIFATGTLPMTPPDA